MIPRQSMILEAQLALVRSAQPNLTQRQLAILMCVGWRGPQYVWRLAEELKVTRPVITRAVTSLAQLGFVRRQSVREDRRQCLVAATDEGLAYLERYSASGLFGGA